MAKKWNKSKIETILTILKYTKDIDKTYKRAYELGLTKNTIQKGFKNHFTNLILKYAKLNLLNPQYFF